VFCQLIVPALPLAALVKKSLLIRFKRLSKNSVKRGNNSVERAVYSLQKKVCILSAQCHSGPGCPCWQHLSTNSHLIRQKSHQQNNRLLNVPAVTPAAPVKKGQYTGLFSLENIQVVFHTLDILTGPTGGTGHKSREFCQKRGT